MDSSMATKGRLSLIGAMVVMVAAAVHPSACGGTAVMDKDDGAGGGTATGTGVTPTGNPTGSPTGTPSGSPTGSPSGSPTGSPTGSPSGSPTGSPTGTPAGTPPGTSTGGPCDNSGSCEDCQYCSFEGPCWSVLNTCQNSQQCINFANCMEQCAGEPNCWDQCAGQFPQGANQYYNLAVCVLCEFCYNDCDGASTSFCQ